MKTSLKENDYFIKRKSIEIVEDFIDRYQSNKNNYYSNIYKDLLKNQINNYVDYLNFREIFSFFNQTNTAKILDLGCGLGDKSIILKELFPLFDIYGLETTNYDDPGHIERKPHLFFKDIYPYLNKKYNINIGLYDGLNIPFDDNFFDIILLYAVIEHIAPENRKVFIDTISKKLKKDGYIVITRCPRYWGLMEFLSRKFNLGAHPWVLKKKELLSLFDEDKFSVEVLKRMNNIPNNHVVSKYFHKILIPLDKFLDVIKWPFSTDYFLIVKKTVDI